ncbi:MAG: WecB/TagA/CpsF family glycosyltransferase, partial [Actinomycetia bacterium]|nr:WecB/TagA/CpsF family glycosyltransferase [Actinomycetes bacterium]
MNAPPLPIGPDRRVEVLGVWISAIDLPMAADTVAGFVAAGRREYVCVTGVHGVIESQTDHGLLEIHNRSGLTTPDGMPLVWCGHRVGYEAMGRVYGPDLFLEVMGRAHEHGWRIYYYGGNDGVAADLAAKMESQFPGAITAGTHTPPYRPLAAPEVDEIVSQINASAADIVWVGLSTPKQERWMAELRPRLEAAVLLGV